MYSCIYQCASLCMHFASLLLSGVPSTALIHLSVIRYVPDASHVSERFCPNITLLLHAWSLNQGCGWRYLDRQASCYKVAKTGLHRKACSATLVTGIPLPVPLQHKPDPCQGITYLLQAKVLQWVTCQRMLDVDWWAFRTQRPGLAPPLQC